MNLLDLRIMVKLILESSIIHQMQLGVDEKTPLLSQGYNSVNKGVIIATKDVITR